MAPSRPEAGVEDRELEAALRTATGGSTLGIAGVGAGTFTMSVCAGLCGALGWDPEMAGWGVGMWIAYGGVVCGFAAVGVLMLGAALFVTPRKGRAFVDRVMRQPETITHVWLLLVRSRGAPGRRPGQLGVGTSLCARTRDDRHFQFVVRGVDAEALLDAIAARCPQAQRGPP